MTDSTKQTTVAGNASQKPAPPRTYEEQLADILSDFKWLFAEIDAHRVEQYRGKHIAVVNHQIVGSDSDPLRLRERIAAEHHMDPERVVIDYIDEPWDV